MAAWLAPVGLRVQRRVPRRELEPRAFFVVFTAQALCGLAGFAQGGRAKATPARSKPHITTSNRVGLGNRDIALPLSTAIATGETAAKNWPFGRTR
jgi:hypothetical protein